MASESQGIDPKFRDHGPVRRKSSQSGLKAGQDHDGRRSPSCEVFQRKLGDLKYYLEGWREIVIYVHQILIWRRAFYPLILWAVISTFFAIVHYSRLSALTTIAALGIFVVLCDYLVPIMQSYVFDPNTWSGAKERSFEDAIEGIICIQDQFYGTFAALSAMKRTRPSLYFVTILSILLFIAWLGSLMDNLLLTYVLVCTAVMLPGMVHKGYLQRFFSCGNKYRLCRRRD